MSRGTFHSDEIHTSIVFNCPIVQFWEHLDIFGSCNIIYIYICIHIIYIYNYIYSQHTFKVIFLLLLQQVLRSGFFFPPKRVARNLSAGSKKPPFPPFPPPFPPPFLLLPFPPPLPAEICRSKSMKIQKI